MLVFPVAQAMQLSWLDTWRHEGGSTDSMVQPISSWSSGRRMSPPNCSARFAAQRLARKEGPCRTAGQQSAAYRPADPLCSPFPRAVVAHQLFLAGMVEQSGSPIPPRWPQDLGSKMVDFTPDGP
jgi:hypothetical protein